MSPRQAPSKAVYELLLRYELGEFAPNVRKRLSEIFRDDPPDALERLELAANYVGVDGSKLELVAYQVDALIDDEGVLAA